MTLRSKLTQSSNAPQSQATASPEKYPQGRFNPKSCKHCAKTFQPIAPSHMYCSQPCVDDVHADRYYQKTYGVSLDEVLALLEAQGGRCAICGSEGFRIEKQSRFMLALDHCHSTGRVRGMLCHNCNRALGLLQEDPEVIQKARDYVANN